MKQDFKNLLVDIGFVTLDGPRGEVSAVFNENKDKMNLIKAAIVAGLYPKVAQVLLLFVSRRLVLLLALHLPCCH
eukprot:m.209079 g.209079  ORF g.209079 m.209079 type:complete len:75 (-) comp26095_c0_seq19:443-667(-)